MFLASTAAARTICMGAAALVILLVAGCAKLGPEGAGPVPPGGRVAAPPEAAGLPSREETIPPLELEPVRIALLLPLSGPAGDVGTALRDAASLALFDAYDPRLELLPFDTAGTPEGARAAAMAAREAGVRMAIGPLFADSIAAAAAPLRAAGIPLIGFSNDRRASI